MNLEIYAVMGAVAAALMVFGGALLAGSRLVRCLRLPQDLPDGPRFSPPPPPVLELPDRVRAAAVRATQELRQARFVRARQAWETAIAAHQVATDHPAALPAAERAEAAAKAAEAAAQADHDTALLSAVSAADGAMADAKRHLPA
jgi:hypothetical protein